MTLRLQKQITDWAHKQFGDVPDDVLYDKLEEEWDELQEALANHDKEGIAEEASDIVHLLFQICERADYDLIKTVRLKFSINQKREWKITDKGTAQHVEPVRNPYVGLQAIAWIKGFNSDKPCHPIDGSDSALAYFKAYDEGIRDARRQPS